MKLKIEQVKPRVSHYSYSNPNSQGALICQTYNWPTSNSHTNNYRYFDDYNDGYFDDSCALYTSYKIGNGLKNKTKPLCDQVIECEVPNGSKICSAYSDRIQSWDADRFKRASEIAGGYCQIWAYKLPGLGDEKLKEFAAVALNLEDKKIWAVRCIHYYNVATGYSCPVIQAIYID